MGRHVLSGVLQSPSLISRITSLQDFDCIHRLDVVRQLTVRLKTANLAFDFIRRSVLRVPMSDSRLGENVRRYALGSLVFL